MKLSEIKDAEILEQIFQKSPKPKELMTQAHLLENMVGSDSFLGLYATEYLLGKCPNYPTSGGHREVFLKRRDNAHGQKKWIIFMDQFCLGKDLEFHFERMPSSRTQEFIKNTRFESKQKAIQAFIKHLESLNGEQGLLSY